MYINIYIFKPKSHEYLILKQGHEVIINKDIVLKIEVLLKNENSPTNEAQTVRNEAQKTQLNKKQSI